MLLNPPPSLSCGAFGARRAALVLLPSAYLIDEELGDEVASRLNLPCIVL